MLTSFIKHRAAVDYALVNKEKRSLMLSTTHIALIEDLVTVLRPLNEATIALQGSMYGTLWQVPHFYSKIEKSFGEYFNVGLSMTAESIMPVMLESFKKRVVLTDWNYASALLYPTLKLAVDCVDELPHSRKKQILVDCFKNLGLEDGGRAAKPTVERSSSESESSEDGFHAELIQAFTLKNQQRTEVEEQTSNISEEVERYLKENINKKTKDFFKQNRSMYPLLAKRPVRIFNFPRKIPLRTNIENGFVLGFF